MRSRRCIRDYPGTNRLALSTGRSNPGSERLVFGITYIDFNPGGSQCFLAFLCVYIYIVEITAGLGGPSVCLLFSHAKAGGPGAFFD